jgi:hypothetical protein
MGLEVEREISGLLHGLISHEKLIGSIGESERCGFLFLLIEVEKERQPHVESVRMDSQVRTNPCPPELRFVEVDML